MTSNARPSGAAEALRLQRVPWLTERRALLMLAGALAIHLTMLLSLFFGYLDGLFDLTDAAPKGIDFFSIYQGGTYLLRGESIYNWVPVDTVPYAAPFRYVPFFAYTVGAAFNLLPPWTGYWLWVSLIELMVVGCAWLTFRLCDERPWGIVGAAIWFAYTPLYVELYMGQWSFLMATLLMVTAAMLAAGRVTASAPTWIASLMAKTNSAVLGPIYLRLGAWRVLLAAGVIVVALNAPYFIAKPHDFKFFSDENLGEFYGAAPDIRVLNANSADLSGMAYLRTLWFALDDGATDVPHAVQSSVIALIVLTAFAATMLPRRANIPVLLAIWIGSFLLVYRAWEHHYVMLLPALALIIARAPEYRAMALWLFVLTAIPTPYALFEAFLSNRPANPSELEILLSRENFWPEWARIAHHAVKGAPLFIVWITLVFEQIYIGVRDVQAGHLRFRPAAQHATTK